MIRIPNILDSKISKSEPTGVLKTARLDLHQALINKSTNRTWHGVKHVSTNFVYYLLHKSNKNKRISKWIWSLWDAIGLKNHSLGKWERWGQSVWWNSIFASATVDHQFLGSGYTTFAQPGNILRMEEILHQSLLVSPWLIGFQPSKVTYTTKNKK